MVKLEKLEYFLRMNKKKISHLSMVFIFFFCLVGESSLAQSVEPEHKNLICQKFDTEYKQNIILAPAINLETCLENSSFKIKTISASKNKLSILFDYQDSNVKSTGKIELEKKISWSVVTSDFQFNDLRNQYDLLENIIDEEMVNFENGEAGIAILEDEDPTLAQLKEDLEFLLPDDEELKCQFSTFTTSENVLKLLKIQSPVLFEVINNIKQDKQIKYQLSRTVKSGNKNDCGYYYFWFYTHDKRDIYFHFDFTSINISINEISKHL